MLRTLSKIAAAVGVLLLIGLGLLAFFLPRLVESEGFRTTLHARAAEALGSPVEWTGMEVALLPPRLVLESPMLVATGGDAEAARLTADSVDLRLATWPLLQRRIAVDSLVLRGLEIVVTRTPEGWQIPIDSGAPSGSEPDAPSSMSPPMPSGTPAPTPSDTPSDALAPTSSAEAKEEGAGTSAFTLDLRRVLITESRIVVRDRLASGEPVDWRLEALRLEAKGRGEAEPIEVEATARLDSGVDAVGRLSAEGTVSLGGVYDLDVGIEALLLEALAGYVPDAELAGRLSGRVSVEGVLSTLAETDLDLQVEDLALEGWGLDLAGDLDLQATQALADPIAFVAALDLGSGGRSRIEGTMSLEGALDAEADLEALDLAPFASLAGGARELAGRATGRLALSMDAERGLTRLAASLDVGSARYVEDAVDVGGDLEIDLELAGLDAEDPIRFDTAIDLATGGRLEAAGVATAAGAVDGRARFDGVDLALLAPWLQAGTEVEGLLTGRVDLRMTADRKIDRLDTDLRLETARIVGARVDVAGAASLIMALGSEGPARIEGGLRLVDGGRLDLEGTATLAGLLDLEGEIERLDLGVATPFLPDPEMQVGGLATGRLKVVGAATSPEFVRLDVGVEDGILRIPDYAIDGPYLLDLEVKEPLSERPRGRVALDLTAARVRYGDQLEKRAGQRAEMVSRFVPDERGEIVFESRIKLRDIDEILLQGLVGDSISVAVTTPIFDLGGWAEMLPALEAYAPSGSVAFEGLGVELVDGFPVGFGGRLQLRGVGLTVPDVGRLQLRGRILGEGRAIRSEGLRMK
ncbi:MAG: AsmA family protein, partial [bacterium]